MATNDHFYGRCLFHFMEPLGYVSGQTAARSHECLKTGADTNSIIDLYLHIYIISKFKSICFKLIFSGLHLTMRTLLYNEGEIYLLSNKTCRGIQQNIWKCYLNGCINSICSHFKDYFSGFAVHLTSPTVSCGLCILSQKKCCCSNK